jgi:RNA polymerase sigma-70 factor (ECF subfamily)
MDTLPMSRATPMTAASSSRSDIDRELLAAYRRGDRAAAEELVDRTYGLVFASLQRLCGDRDRAADLTQETYRRAWQSLDGFRGRSRVSTWLYRIAYTTFLNSLRGGGRTLPLDEDAAASVADPSPSPEDETSAGESGEALRLAVLGLPGRLRYVVTAHFWGEVSVKEIARDEGVSPVAVRKRLEKAKGLLAASLEEID